MTSGLFHGGVTALYVLYATRDLGIGPLVLGLVFAAGGLGAIPGALLSERSARRFGTGPTIICGILLGQLTLLLIPLAGRFPAPATIATLAAAQVLGGIVNTIANVNQWSLRQAVTPDHLQGRVTASHRFLVYGTPPLGALLGGFFGAAIGLGPAILLCALGALLGPLWLVFSPLRHLREQPVDEATADRSEEGTAGGTLVPERDSGVW
jgi:predicted MFS family arabinose efflux permease